MAFSSVKSRGDFKRLTAAQVEEQRSDHVVNFRKCIDDCEKVLHNYKDGNYELRDLDREREALDAAQQVLLDFKTQYMHRDDLGDDVLPENVDQWWVPVQEAWHKLKVDCSKAVGDKRLEEKMLKEAEIEAKKKASEAEEKDHKDIEIKREIRKAKAVFKVTLTTSRRMLKSGIAMIPSASEVREDLEELGEAEETASIGYAIAEEIFDKEESLNDFVEATSEGEKVVRYVEIDTLLDEIRIARRQANVEKQKRWDGDEVLRKRGVEAELRFKPESKYDKDEKKETRRSEKDSTSHPESYVKKEAVTLPDFMETTETASVTAYPIWKSSFECLISDYPTPHRPHLLRKHLGKLQLKLLEGVSDDYVVSMRRLEQHYGDINRLVRVITDEIAGFAMFKGQDYLKMVEYSQLLQNSYRKLQKLGRETELNNAYAMRNIVNKYDIKIREDWVEHMETKPGGRVPDEFHELVTWLEVKKIPLWKRLGSLTDCSRNAPAGGKNQQAGLAGVVGQEGSAGKPCDFCGSKDHRTYHCKAKRDQECEHCNKRGHSKDSCFKLHPNLRKGKDDKPKKPPTGNGARGGGRGDGKKKHDSGAAVGVKLNIKLFRCANCRVRDGTHDTNNCFYISKNLGKKPDFRVALIKDNMDCGICLEDHQESSCTKKNDCGCLKHHNLHRFACKDAVFTTVVGQANCELEERPSSILDFMRVKSAYEAIRPIVGVFWDSGATSNFCTDKVAEEFKFPGNPVVIYLQTMEGIKEHSCNRYYCKMKKEDGEMVKFMAYGCEEIFEGMFQFGTKDIQDLFPSLKTWSGIKDALRPDRIDFLLGSSQKSWLPERGERAIGGGDLWTMVNQFGTSIGGSHPRLTCDGGQVVNKSSAIFHCEVVGEVKLSSYKDMHDMEFCGARIVKEQLDMKYLLDRFNESETLGIANSLACGRCWCNSCPLPGERFSFQGEKDLKHIKSCLSYNEKSGRWFTDLPWKTGSCANDLPETEKVAEKLMLQTERSLSKRPDWRDSYNGQIQDFLTRGVARVVSKEELEWCKREGIRLYYLAHLAVDQPQKTTPVRFCIDASRQQMGGPAPNDLLVIGPKSYVNNLAGILLSFRNGLENCASTCDIAKMHQRILLNYESQMQQLFLWRFCEEKQEIRTISIIVNTFGFVNANSSATASLHTSADKVHDHFITQINLRAEKVKNETTIRKTYDTGSKQQVEDILGEGSKLTDTLVQRMGRVKGGDGELDLQGISEDALIEMWTLARDIVQKLSYVDDILSSFKSVQQQRIVKRMVDLILTHAGMPSKGWINSGEGKEEDAKEIGVADQVEKTLGMFWLIKKDEFTFKINVKLSGKKSKKSYYVEKWSIEELLKNPPHVLTRRMVLSELSKVYDPVGFISPVLLEAKLLVRMSWNGEKSSIPLWDDALPESQRLRWCRWFVEIHKLEEVVIRRSVVPGEIFEGLPDLVALADGSPLAFGAAIYLVYRLLSGGFWSSLLCARSKISKKDMNTVPRVELNGSLCAERLKNFVMKKTNIKIRNCYHLVDSQIILHWVSGDKTDLGVYEGTRVSEILTTSTKKDDGGLLNWGHVARELNSSDLCTRPSCVEQVKSGFWLTGPAFLSEKAVEDWPVNWQVHKSTKVDLDTKQKITRDFNLDFEMMYGVRDFEALYNVKSRTETLGKDTNWYSCTRVLDLLEKHSDLRIILRKLAWVNTLVPRLAMVNREHKDRRILRTGKLTPINFKELPVEQRVLSKEDHQLAKRFCIRAVQTEFRVDMEKELNRDQVLKKKGQLKYRKTRYSKLAMFKDENGIYRVGSRLRMCATVTESGNMPILIPEKSRYHFLQMKKSHDKCHWGEKGTKIRFRMDGYWALNSTEVARNIIKDCYFCGGESPRLLVEKMGDFKPEVIESTEPFTFLELDLFGPYKCKEGRTTVKRWGVLIIDAVSSAAYADILEDYSAPSVIMSLQRFESYFGWPKIISSDPGTQLESAGGKLSEWWKDFGKELMTLAGTREFEWNISPAHSPWYQGKVERSIAVIKRLLRSSIGDRQMSTLGLQTALRTCVSVMNSRPINVDCEVDKRGEYKIVSPNDLLLGRNTRCFDLSELTDQFKDSAVQRNMEMIKQVRRKFYKDVSTYVHPKFVLRAKWHYSIHDMPVEGDVVRIHEFNTFSKNWKMAVVKKVLPSKDGKSRSFELEYVILREGKKPRRVVVSRSGQKLSLLAKGAQFSHPVQVREVDEIASIVPDQ